MLQTLIQEIPSFTLISISIIVLIFNFSRKNNNFFDVRSVFKEHFRIFENNKIQLIIFFGVPFLLALAIVKFKCIDKDIINNINFVLTIFISMFFGMISVLCSFQKKVDTRDENYNKVLNQTFNVLLFECILSIIILMISFVQLFINKFEVTNWLIIVSILIYYLVLVVVLNIFMILKRLKKLFDYRV